MAFKPLNHTRVCDRARYHSTYSSIFLAVFAILLIPVTLTTEERVQELMQQLDTILALQVEIQSRVLDISREEKVVIGQQELERVIQEALSALQEGEFDTAEKLLDEGQLIATDLDALTAGSDTVSPETVPDEPVESTASSTTALEE